MDPGFIELEKKHGKEGTQSAAESHDWALRRIGQMSKELGIECEYRILDACHISQYEHSADEHNQELGDMQEELEKAKELGLEAHMDMGRAIKGWDGKIDQRDAAIFGREATFHPPKYLNGILGWLKKQPSFQCYTHTRVLDIKERGVEVLGIGNKDVQVKTEGGNTVTCKNAIEATCVPLQKLSVVAQMEFLRTYCIAIRFPTGSVEDVQIYEECEPYKYVRLTKCDDKHDYLIVGGCDHKVGQESAVGRFEELEDWTRKRFTHAGSVDYKWSGQIFKPVDGVAFIGRNQGQSHIYIVTGDIGNGLTHGTIAGKLLADEIHGVDNPWSKLYNPTRVGSIAKPLPTMVAHDIQINAQYKRLLQSDIADIEDLAPGQGGVLNPTAGRPIAVYKDDEGVAHKMNALCPHMKGVLCWNSLEKSWDCSIHASRFSKDGICVMGPSKENMQPFDEEGAAAQEAAKTT